MKVKVEQEAIRGFIDSADSYCGFVEEADRLDRVAFLKRAQVLLAGLYSRALLLPTVEPNTTDTPSKEISSANWQQLFSSLRAKLGATDVYSMIFDPTHPENDDPVCGGLADDLADIYRDIKDGLLNLDDREALADLVWEWKFSFETHWGRHAIDALRTIHSLLYGPYAITEPIGIGSNQPQSLG